MRRPRTLIAWCGGARSELASTLTWLRYGRVMDVRMISKLEPEQRGYDAGGGAIPG